MDYTYNKLPCNPNSRAVVSKVYGVTVADRDGPRAPVVTLHWKGPGPVTGQATMVPVAGAVGLSARIGPYDVGYPEGGAPGQVQVWVTAFDGINTTTVSANSFTMLQCIIIG